MNGSSSPFDPDNKVRLPFTNRDYSNFVPIERTQAWRYLLPYMLEPTDRKARNRLRALQANRLIGRHDKKIKEANRKGRKIDRLNRLKGYDQRQLAKVGGPTRLSMSPSADQLKAFLKAEARPLVTVHYLVWTFLRLAEHGDGIDLWPSMTKARRLLATLPADPTAQACPLFTEAYKTKKDIDRAWSIYKPSAHLVFGYIQSTKVDRGPKAGAAASLISLLGYAAHAQQALTNLNIRNTKRPTLEPDQINWLPELIGIDPATPNLPSLTASELQAFQG